MTFMFPAIYYLETCLNFNSDNIAAGLIGMGPGPSNIVRPISTFELLGSLFKTYTDLVKYGAG